MFLLSEVPLYTPSLNSDRAVRPAKLKEGMPGGAHVQSFGFKSTGPFSGTGNAPNTRP